MLWWKIVMWRAFCYHLSKRSHNLSLYCLFHLIFVSEKRDILCNMCKWQQQCCWRKWCKLWKKPKTLCSVTLGSTVPNAGSELVLSDGRRLTLTACGCLWWKHGSENLFHQGARESSQRHRWPFLQQHKNNNVLWTAMESKAKEAVDVSKDGFR